MSRKKKPQTQKQKEELADVPPQTAIDELKDEIIEEVKALSSGRINTVYALVQKGRELIELEKAVVLPASNEAVAENEF